MDHSLGKHVCEHSKPSIYSKKQLTLDLLGCLSSLGELEFVNLKPSKVWFLEEKLSGKLPEFLFWSSASTLF